MSSEVDICNLALSTLGTKANIQSMTEDSDEAAQCNIWYAQTRDSLLRAGDWNFARRKVVMAQYNNPAPDGWSYAYVQPSDCIRVLVLTEQLNVIVPPANDATRQMNIPRIPHEVAGDGSQKLVYCNISPALLIYTSRVTVVDLFDEGFKAALISQLAANIAYPITQKATTADAMAKRAINFYNRAMAVDADESNQTFMDYVPEYIQARF